MSVSASVIHSIYLVICRLSSYCLVGWVLISCQLFSLVFFAVSHGLRLTLRNLSFSFRAVPVCRCDLWGIENGVTLGVDDNLEDHGCFGVLEDLGRSLENAHEDPPGLRGTGCGVMRLLLGARDESSR